MIRESSKGSVTLLEKKTQELHSSHTGVKCGSNNTTVKKCSKNAQVHTPWADENCTAREGAATMPSLHARFVSYISAAFKVVLLTHLVTYT